MPRIVEYITTPNPHALKCVLDAPPTPLADADKVRSYRDAASAAADPLAAKLFAIEGVRNILIVNNWITVGKAEAATWKSLKPALERALA
ncbi:MAG TPA: NifU N-terminal domain-containing protein [Phycisphaerales bacterium]|nr:NifU N-terminal domain-containing protein [Phycisphaerales bacterium]